jgi:hypothetical protein
MLRTGTVHSTVSYDIDERKSEPKASCKDLSCEQVLESRLSGKGIFFCYDGHCAPSITSRSEACVTAEQMFVGICRTLMACLEPLAASLGMITMIRSPFQQQLRAATFSMFFSSPPVSPIFSA